MPQESSLTQAIDLAGGTRFCTAKLVHPLHSRRKIDRRIFSLKRDAPSGDYRNPILTSGYRTTTSSPLNKSFEVLNEITHQRLASTRSIPYS